MNPKKKKLILFISIIAVILTFLFFVFLFIYKKETNTDLTPEQTAQVTSSLKEIADRLDSPTIKGNGNGSRELSAPKVPFWYDIELIGADYEEVLDYDGTIYPTYEDKEITLGFKISKQGISVESKPFTLMIPASCDAITDTPNAKPAVIPALAEWLGGTGNFMVADTSRIIIRKEDAASLNSIANIFKEDYEVLLDRPISVVNGTKADAKAGDFFLTLEEKDSGLHKEGYLANISDIFILEGEDPIGIHWGTQTILQILSQTKDTLPKGYIRDYPKYPVRGFGIDVARKTVSLSMIKDIAKTMSYYKMNDLQLHLNDNAILSYTGRTDTFENAFAAYSGFRLESSVVNEKKERLTSSDMYYSKEDMRSLIKESRTIGVNIVPELDTPAHSLPITKIFPEYALTHSPESVDHLDLNNPEAIELVTSIWNEYTSGENPVFDRDTTLHIGMDEYYSFGELYRQYANILIDNLKETGQTIRLWGSLSNMQGETQVPSENIQLNIWNTMWANPTDMYQNNYSIINTQGNRLYLIPGGGYDYLDNKSLYETFRPNVFVEENETFTIPPYSKQMLGASYFMWNDLCDNLAIGLSEYDLFDRFFMALPVLSETTWSDAADKTYDELMKTFAILDTAPNTNPRKVVKSSQNTYLAYTFDRDTDTEIANGCDITFAYDYSGNALDTTRVQNAELLSGKEGMALQLNGGESYVQTPLHLIGPDLSVSFWVKMDETSYEEEQILFEHTTAFDTYAFKAVQKETGQVGFSREGYDFSFDYTLPEQEWVYLTIETHKDVTHLYVNHELISTLGSSDTWSEHATLVFPAERIGSSTHAFKGLIDNLTISPYVNSSN